MTTAINNMNMSSHVTPVGTNNNTKKYHNTTQDNNVRMGNNNRISNGYQTGGSRTGGSRTGDNTSRATNDLKAFENFLEVIEIEISNQDNFEQTQENSGSINSGLLNLNFQSLNFLNASGQAVNSDNEAFDNGKFFPL